MRKVMMYQSGLPIKRKRQIGIGSIGLLLGFIGSVIALNLQSVSAATAFPQPPGYDIARLNTNTDNVTNNDIHGVSYDGRYVLYSQRTFNPNEHNEFLIKDTYSQQIKRVTVDAQGNYFPNVYGTPAMSSNGRYVGFEVFENNIQQVYVFDAVNNVSVRASSTASGEASTGNVSINSISDNGKVLLSSYYANTNLVTNFNPTQNSMLIKNLNDNTITKLPFVDPTGNGDNWTTIQDGIISADGSTVAVRAFDSTTNYLARCFSGNYCQPVLQVVAFKLGSGNAVQVTPTVIPYLEVSNLHNYWPSAISRNGDHILLYTHNDHLLGAGVSGSGDSTAYAGGVEGLANFYLKDFNNGSLSAVDPKPSRGGYSGGVNSTYGAAVSDDGRYVGFPAADPLLDDTYPAFSPVFSNSRLVNNNLYVRDMTKPHATIVGIQLLEAGSYAGYAPGSRSFVFLSSEAIDSNDTNGRRDLYILRPQDIISPIVTGQASRQPDANIWYNHDVQINWQATDPAPSSGTPTTPVATVASTEGQNVPYVSSPSCDPAGNCATGSFNVSLDKTAPTLGQVAWSANPKAVTTGSTLSVPASDSLSGVAGGEYFIGNDPGQGNGATMTGSGNTLTTDFSTNFAPGVYAMGVRAKDAAGNWGLPTATMLVVFDPSGPGVTGKNKKDLVPSVANGDILPGLSTASPGVAVDYGFTVAYRNGTLRANNDFQLTYATGSQCNSPRASNCHNFSIDASGFDWMVIDQANNSRSQFQGVARVVADGVTTSNPFSVTATDGDRMSPATGDEFELQVYAQGSDPSTATSIYKVSGVLARSNGIKIR